MELILGTIGAITILISFLLNQYHKINSDSFWYDFLNLIGSILLLVYSILIDSVPFIVINIIWGIFSLKDLVQRIPALLERGEK